MLFKPKQAFEIIIIKTLFWHKDISLTFATPRKEFQAGVVKLVDTLDLGSSVVRHGGSSPSTRTKPLHHWGGFFLKIII